MNIVPKVHKLTESADSYAESTLKGRPIVNGYATVNTEPSKLLGKLFKNCLDKMMELFHRKDIHYPIVNSSRQVIDRISVLDLKAKNPDNIYFISYDFSALYTSIRTNTVFDTIHFLGHVLQLRKEQINLMKELFNFIKANAYFTVGNKRLYLQKEGFAMGSFDSCDGSNLVLLKAEYFMLQNPNIKRHILDFFRFIDDGSLIVYIKPDQIKELIEKIVSYYPKELEVEFKVTKFQTIFLDICYGLGQCTYANGKLHYRVYQKPFNSYAYLNYKSNHPYAVFKGIIQTECHRYMYLSCNKKEYDNMCKLFKIRLRKCGYPKHFISRHMIEYDGKHKNRKTKPKKNTRKILMKIQFDKSHNQHKIFKHI